MLSVPYFDLKLNFDRSPERRHRRWRRKCLVSVWQWLHCLLSVLQEISRALSQWKDCLIVSVYLITKLKSHISWASLRIALSLLQVQTNDMIRCYGLQKQDACKDKYSSLQCQDFERLKHIRRSNFKVPLLFFDLKFKVWVFYLKFANQWSCLV